MHLCRSHTRRLLSFGATVALLFACTRGPKQVPFPSDESEFSQPTSKPLKLGNPVPIEWEEIDAAKFRAGPVRKLNVKSLPAKPFTIGYPFKMPVPPTVKELDWNAVPDTVFDFNSLPSQPLKFKTFVLPPPVISKAGVPIPRTVTSRGVMDIFEGLGLPGYARCFLTDANGRLWIGTDKGICRYDGVNLEFYGYEHGISEPNLWSLCEDNDHRIWMGSVNGRIFILDRDAGLIHELLDTFPRGSTYSIAKDAAGQLWINRNGAGLIVVDTKNKIVRGFTEKQGLAGDLTITLLVDRADHIWIASNKGVTYLDPASRIIKRLTTQQGLIANNTLMITEDAYGNMIIGGTGGVNILNSEKNRITQVGKSQGLAGNFVLGALRTRDDRIWVGVPGNLYTLDLAAGTLEKYLLDASGNIPFNLWEDLQGQLWVGYTNGGGYIINRSHGRPTNLTKGDGLNSVSIWAIQEARDGTIWLGSTDGIDIYDPAERTLRHIGMDQGLTNSYAGVLMEDSRGRIWTGGGGAGLSIINPMSGTIYSQGNVIVTRIAEDHLHNIWIGTGNGSVFVYNDEKKSCKRIKNLEAWKGNRMSALIEDRNNKIWLSDGTQGLMMVDTENNTMQSFTTSQGALSNVVYCTMEAKDGSIWIGTSRGVDQISPDRKTVLSFTIDQGLANNEVWTLNDRNGVIYAGTTKGFSMMKADVEAKWTITNFGKPQGLAEVDVNNHSGMVTGSGEFWACINNTTLLVMDEPTQDTLRSTTFITDVQLLGNSIVRKDLQAMKKGIAGIDSLWNTNLSLYSPKSEALAEFAPKLLFSYDSVDHQYFLPVSPQLESSQNYVAFSYAGMDYSDPDKVRYRYMLEGIDKAWSTISASTVSESYRDLPPRAYTFKVCSRGANGLWSTPATYHFTILPPWWQSWWAYGGYVIFLGFLGYRVHLFQRAATVRKERERTRERELAQAKEIEKAYNDLKATQTQLIQSEKMASLGELTAGIAHEIQNPLNFVNNFSEINKELLQEMKDELDKGQLDEAKKVAGSIIDNEEKIIFHGKRADSIVKGMLQHSRASSGLKEPTDINALADEYLRLAFHGLRAQDKSFNASMKTDFDPSLGKVNVVPQDMGRAILNLITNAFHAVSDKKKETSNGYDPTVTVSTHKNGNKIIIKVTDNGKGIPTHILDKIFQPFFTTKPSGKGTGLGLSMSYDIITKVHHGQIDVDTRPGEGTSFIITIPNSNA